MRSAVAARRPLAAAAEDELAAAAGLVLVVRLLAARVERLPRPVQLYHQGNLKRGYTRSQGARAIKVLELGFHDI